MKPSEYSRGQAAIYQVEQEGWLNRRYLDLILKQLPRLRYGTLDLMLPSGQRYQFGEARQGEPRAEVRLKSLSPVRRLFRGGIVGWAESYMDGEWDSPDLVSLVRWAIGNEKAVQSIFDGHPVLSGLIALFTWVAVTRAAVAARTSPTTMTWVTSSTNFGWTPA